MNFKKLTSGFLVILTVTSLILTGTSCSDTETTDSTPFAIYYSGMTDIGPSMNAKISAPTYIGATPADFTITKIILENESVNSESFVIDATTGEIEIKNSDNLAVGLYHLSISCVSNGKTYNFADAVSINMMRPVPEGITVEPNLLTIDYADVKTSDAKAQVKTEGEHVSISKYSIAESGFKDYFTVNASGEVSINKNYEGDILPGIYKVALKLQTEAGEGIFADAVTFNITSKPLALTYTPNKGKMEEATEGPTSYTTNVPTLKGSLEGVVYRIANITPATDKIKIDASTGVISVAEGHGFKADETYVIDVNVKNIYNTTEEADKVFEGVFTLEVVGFIAPIENFTYENVTKTQATPFTIAHTDAFKGDEVTFELGELAAELQGQLNIDATTGTITAKKGNTIPVGTHTVAVKAKNVKGEQTTTFTLAIEKNKNFFTTITYGNNLGLPEGSAFQYRFNSAEELAKTVIPAPKTDIPEGVTVTWKVQNKLNMSNGKVGKDGALNLANITWKDATCGMIMVTATAGEGDEAVSVSVPVFFHFAAPVKDVTINYTPFVLQVNPKTGGRSVAPTVTGADKSKVLMDYRRDFSYYNINGSESHISGMMKNDGKTDDFFMNQVWRNFYTAIGVKPNYGARKPMSYYDNAGSETTTLAYIDPADKSVVINPGKWMGEDKVYANGVMSGQITFVTDGASAGLGNGNKIFPILVWFDEKF